MKTAFTLAVCLAALQPAWCEATQILVRTRAPHDASRLESLRKQLGVPETGARHLGASNVRLWTTTKSEKEARALLREHSEAIASEIVDGDYRDLVWPVGALHLPARVRQNLDLLERRGNQRWIQVLRIREREIAAAYLRRGIPGEKPRAPTGTLQWKLNPNTVFTSNRVAWKAHDRRGQRLGWIGEIDAAKGKKGSTRYAGGFGSATFFDGHLYARFEYGNSIYQVVPLGDGFHAAVEIDPARVPEDQPDEPVTGDAPGGGELPDVTSRRVCEPDMPDEPVTGDAPGGGDLPDEPVAGDAPGGGDLPDEPVTGDAPGGGDLPDRMGYCVNACMPATTARGHGCYEGPRTCAVVNVGVAYTKEALGRLPAVISGASTRWGMSIPIDAEHYAQFLVDLTSASFTRSGVHARLRLSGIHAFSGLETAPPDAARLLRELRGIAQNPAVAPVRKWRDASRSDLVMVLSTLDREIVNGQTKMIAGLSPPWTYLPKAKDAYSIVEINNADSQLSFLHELGHHFGAMHDASISNMPHWYGRGFRNDCEWRTVMAYAADAKTCPAGVPRLAMWSSCNLWYRGVPVGGPLQNNARTLNERAGRVDAFRP